MFCGEYKEKLTSKRFNMGLFKMNLQHTDIITFVNYAWNRSFARIDQNQKAIRERGWGPLNQILLSHPEIVTSKNIASTQEVSLPTLESDDTSTLSSSSPTPQKGIDIEELNFNNGFAGDVIATILRKSQRD